MTDYNDGNWHGWSGGECPVHPKTVVDAVWLCTDGDVTIHRDELAEALMWEKTRHGEAVAFRVVKEHREPREMWICIYDASAWDSKDQAEKHDEERGPIIHVREVIE